MRCAGVCIYLSRPVPGPSITKLLLLCAVSGNVMRSTTCPIHAEWNLNLSGAVPYRISGSQSTVQGISFVSPVHARTLHYLTGTNHHYWKTWWLKMSANSLQQDRCVSHLLKQNLDFGPLQRKPAMLFTWSRIVIIFLRFPNIRKFDSVIYQSLSILLILIILTSYNRLFHSYNTSFIITFLIATIYVV